MAKEAMAWKWENGFLVGTSTSATRTEYAENCSPVKLARSSDYDPRKTVVPFDGSQRLWLTRFLNCKTPAGFLEYAKHYGMLGLATPVETPFEVNGELVTHAESLKIWQDAHRLISVAANLWEAANAGKAEEVARLLGQQTGDLTLRVQTELLPVCGAHNFLYLEKTTGNTGSRTHLLAFARRASAALANAALRDHASPKVLMDGRGNAALLLTADDKLGAMAGELALWMTGVRRYAVCPGCGRWNDVSASHPSRQFCGGSRGVNCRKKDSRRKLAAEG